MSDEIKKRIPLFKNKYLKNYIRHREHESSPIWNYDCGDRITKFDLKYIDSFNEKLQNRTFKRDNIFEEIQKELSYIKENSIFIKKQISNKNNFFEYSTCSRVDISTKLVEMVPLNSNLERLIINSTSGTTGHPIKIPNHPSVIACYSPMTLFALKQHGVKPEFTHENTACLLLCSQQNTAVYSTITPMLNGTGFAKLNLNSKSWKKESDRESYIKEFQPEFFSGDPISYIDFLNLGIHSKPKAFISTAMELSDELANSLKKKFNSAVIDFFSSNETGPLFYKCKAGEFHLLPTDTFLEVVDDFGNTLGEGKYGEITITQFRNPYLPLLRYRTGDFGELDFSICNCGDSQIKIKKISSRKPILFQNMKNSIVNTVDIVRVMKLHPILQFQFIQKKDKSCELYYSSSFDLNDEEKVKLKNQIENLFENEISLELKKHKFENSNKIINFIKEE